MTVSRPSIILVRPQLAENIGMCARAMLNFGLTDLRLVAPREGKSLKGAQAAASGAVQVLKDAAHFETVEEAIADLHKVYATTARERWQEKSYFSGEGAAADMYSLASESLKTGILFGPERAGLENDDVALADAIVTFPVNPAFSSLNLAQAVLLVGYEWFKISTGSERPRRRLEHSPPAERRHVLAFFDHIEGALDDAKFFHPPDKRALMIRNFRNIFHRLEMTEQDVQTLRGAVTSLVEGQRGRRAQTPSKE